MKITQATPSRLRSKHDPKTDVVIWRDRVGAAPAGSTAEFANSRPASAAENPVEAAARTLRIENPVRRVITIQILHPFINVAVDILEAKGIRQLLADCVSPAGAVGRIPCVIAEQDVSRIVSVTEPGGQARQEVFQDALALHADDACEVDPAVHLHESLDREVARLHRRVGAADLHDLTRTVALQLSLFDVLIPFWMVWALAGWKGVRGVWPALLVAGGTFAAVQLAVAWWHGPWLVNILSALISMAALALFLRFWRPAEVWRLPGEAEAGASSAPPVHPRPLVARAWAPWLLLSLWMFVWGLPGMKAFLDRFSLVRVHVPGLDGMVMRMPPVVIVARPEGAVFDLAWLSASGTAILLTALVAGVWMGYRPRDLLVRYAAAFRQVGLSLLTICTMMAIGFVIRYSGMDGCMGLAFARSGPLYPFFGTLLGWLGVFITGSDTSSNVLFGSLQRITAGQLGIEPVLMAAANSSGGVMGKMINAQSVVVAGAAVNLQGREGHILRYVFFHSLALVGLVGLVVMAMAYFL